MRIGLFLILSISLTFFACQNEPNHIPVDADYGFQKVNPFIGTDGKGKTYPGATTPFGMVQLSPDNGRSGWDWISGYFYPDSIIAGFSHTHLSGTGIGELYDISFFPLTEPYRYHELDQEGGTKAKIISSLFSHEQEQAEPGYYEVVLKDYDIKVALTATTRCGFQSYLFPEGKEAQVKLDLGYSRNWDATTETSLQILNDSTIAGYRFSTGWAKDQRVFFFTQFSRPFTNPEEEEQNVKRLFKFGDLEGSPLYIKTGISSVSTENAKLNLDQEIPHWNFAQTRQQAKDQWIEQLAKIDFRSSIPGVEEVFYTALYQSMLAPTIFQDVNGHYKSADSLGTSQTSSGNRYTTFSLWDTFRAAHPLFTILHPDRINDMINSMLAHYEEYGLLPVWDLLANETDMMIGYHAVPVITDAYLKGYRGFDAEKALEAMLASAKQDNFGLLAYRTHGYIPMEDYKESVSLTLEYAFDDWCIAQMAKAMGKTDIQKEFEERAQYYRPLFDAQTGFMRGKDKTGQWQTPFDPFAYGDPYIEANAWQYSWFVPHDVPGLIALFGSEEAFIQKLDAIYEADPRDDGELPEWISGTIGQYVHGNEPGHHVPYLYNYTKQAWKTQRQVRNIALQLHKPTPDGICGNEDCGQMSAWYIFSALGFYPLNPAEGIYQFGCPLMDEATIHLADGKTFKVIAENNLPDHPYIQKVSLNGEPLTRSYITHAEIMQGGRLEFVMGKEPVKGMKNVFPLE